MEGLLCSHGETCDKGDALDAPSFRDKTVLAHQIVIECHVGEAGSVKRWSCVAWRR